MIIRDTLKLLLFFILVPSAGLVQAQESFSDVPQVQQAQLLIESGKSREAYALLQPLELEQAGNISYDYLLGISALNSGKASQAVFALERVQESDAGYGEVGLWLAIAFYRSGDMERAIAGFNSVLMRSQSTRSKARANEYLAFITQPSAPEDSGKKDTTSSFLLGKVESGIGYDSNISNTASNNPGSSQYINTLSTPTSNLGGMEGIMNLGLEGRIPMAGNYAFLSVDEGLRKYRGHNLMNSETMMTKGGMNFTGDSGNVFRINLALRQFHQQGFADGVKDIDNDYDIKGAEGHSKFKLSDHDYLGFLAQYNQLHFYANEQEDTHQVMLGANYMHIFQAGGDPVVYFGYTHILDTAIRMKTAYNPSYNNGLTVASRVSDNYTLYLQYTLTKDINIFSTAYVNFRRDTGAFARDSVVAFGEDRTKYVSFGLDWRPATLWTVALQVASMSNDSDISLYSYDKTETRLTLRREFNSL